MDNMHFIKQEFLEQSGVPEPIRKPFSSHPVSVIDLSSSDSDSDDSSSSAGEGGGIVARKRSRGSAGGKGGVLNKKKKLEELGVILPEGFLDPLPPKEAAVSLPLVPAEAVVPPQNLSGSNGKANVGRREDGMTDSQGCKQFWKAGDFEGPPSGDWDISTGGMDHVRVHPKFLHSNATSHKWVLGAFAELLDNSMDEVCSGATYVNMDMIRNKKDGNKMLLIEDNGGGMDPDKMRQCMSLGYSAKSKIADTIGQYGNGFKTSTMRLGADVIVFSRCAGIDGKRATQSIGLLSYTFLRSTGKEDIVVPMLDYERRGLGWNKIIRSSAADWNRNVEAVVQWSPFSSEADLLRQFNQMQDHGTRIIIYNLWEDDQGLLELDFDTDPHDIQIRGVNRDEKNIEMAKQYPNSRHFLTYRHSLRSYASILYLRIPPAFRIILRGKDVEHHNVVNDMMMTQEVTYRPQPGTDGVLKDSNMVATVTIGFVKDAKDHIDVQGFNVYHKNRLIKPFWRLWHAPGSDGRGVIGVLEANFVEPAHDKQGFERTIVLSRLETRLVQMQKTYWSTNCHKIGYAPRNKKAIVEAVSGSGKVNSISYQKHHSKSGEKHHSNGHPYSKGEKGGTKSGAIPSSPEPSSHSEELASGDEVEASSQKRRANGNSGKIFSAMNSFRNRASDTAARHSSYSGNVEAGQDFPSGGRPVRVSTRSQSKGDDGGGENECSPSNQTDIINQLREENLELKERLKKREEEILGDLLRDLQEERERSKSLEAQIQEKNKQIEDLNKEQESLIDIFSEERERRDTEEETLRKKLKEASNTIQQLLDRVRQMEKKTPR